MQRLQADLERMQRELAGANGLLTSSRSDTAAELARGSALEQAVKERDGRIASLEHDIASRDARIDDLEAQLREALEEHEALRKARRREADPPTSAASRPRSSTARRTAGGREPDGRLGDADVRLAVEGCTLPRPVRVTSAGQQRLVRATA